MEERKEELREIIKGYKEEDSYNTDEMGLFFDVLEEITDVSG